MEQNVSPLENPRSISFASTASILGVALLASFLRAPKLLIQGRVYAEEGTTYLRFAWNAKVIDSLLAPHQGYYSLLDNLTALIAARMLPLSLVALFFIWVAQAIQLLTVYLAVTSESLKTIKERVLVMFAFVFAAGSLEGWLSLECCQFYLPICAALILASTERRWQTVRSSTLRLGVLLLAGLSGVTSCFLLPLFWLKAARSKNRGALLDASILTVCTLVEAIIVIANLHAGARAVFSSQVKYLGPILFERIIVLPLLTGRGVIFANRAILNHSAVIVPLAWLTLILSFILLFRLSKTATKATVWLTLAAMVTGILNWAGCDCGPNMFRLSPIAESRYFFTADVLVTLAICFVFTSSSSAPVRRFTGLLIATLLLSGGLQYVRGNKSLNDYASWQPQIDAWQKNPATPIAIAPRSWDQSLQLPRDRGNDDLPASIYDSNRRALPIE